MTIREQIHAYLDTLPPHVRERKAAQLLVAAAEEIKSLEEINALRGQLEELRLLKEPIDEVLHKLDFAMARLEQLSRIEVNEKSKPNPTA